MTPVICIVGYSDAGKTTLVEKLVVELKKRGHRVGTVKHSAHGSNFDTRGKDSWRHFAAGADAVVSDSPEHTVMIRKPENLEIGSRERMLSLAKHMEDMDVIIVEGYKNAGFPKIEVFRSGNGREPVCFDNATLAAVVTDADLTLPVPVFGLEESGRLADFIESRFIRSHGFSG